MTPTARRKRRQRADARRYGFPPMIRLVNGELLAGLALGFRGVSGVPEAVALSKLILRIQTGSFRRARP
jgi:hypothetical protein